MGRMSLNYLKHTKFNHFFSVYFRLSNFSNFNDFTPHTLADPEYLFFFFQKSTVVAKCPKKSHKLIASRFLLVRRSSNENNKKTTLKSERFALQFYTELISRWFVSVYISRARREPKMLNDYFILFA